MSDPTSIFPPTAAEPVQFPALNKDRRRTLLAAVLSVVLPGAGHLLVKRRGTGIVFLTIFCGLFFVCWPLRLLHHLAALIGFVFGMLALCIFSTVNAAYGDIRRGDRPSQWWLVLLLPLAFGTAVIHVNWVTRSAGFQVFQVPSRSMENTVHMDGRVFVDRWHYRSNTPAHGDIVIYLNKEGIYVIKRVIARGGETIRSSNGIIFINGQLISEPYVIHNGSAPFEMNNFGPFKIPAGQLFVMGDNRDISLDSRSPEVGPINVSSLQGRALYKVGSFRDRTYKDIR
jgi:signal peptidase I